MEFPFILLSFLKDGIYGHLGFTKKTGTIWNIVDKIKSQFLMYNLHPMSYTHNSLKRQQFIG